MRLTKRKIGSGFYDSIEKLENGSLRVTVHNLSVTFCLKKPLASAADAGTAMNAMNANDDVDEDIIDVEKAASFRLRMKIAFCPTLST